jgi:integrase
MGRKRTPGLLKRGNIWHINKKVGGQRICESTGADQLDEAEQFLARRLEMIRQARVYGVRPKRTFREAATKFLLEHAHKKSISSDKGHIILLDKFIGDIAIDKIHMGTLQLYIEARRKESVKTRTINHGLQVVRHLLNLAASKWFDEYGLTWITAAPKIKLFPEHDARKAYPLDWDEQERLFAALPEHLHDMALFAVNTGCRDQEICRLRWQWETNVNQEISVFVIPGKYVKNGEDRVVVLNKIAKEVVERQNGKHPEFVFTYKNKPVTRMLNHGWLTAREKVGLDVRVHDLKHTFGRRLRSAGVSFEDRQDLLGHKSARITTHYSSAELVKLWEATNKVCGANNQLPSLTLLKPL